MGVKMLLSKTAQQVEEKAERQWSGNPYAQMTDRDF